MTGATFTDMYAYRNLHSAQGRCCTKIGRASQYPATFFSWRLRIDFFRGLQL